MLSVGHQRLGHRLGLAHKDRLNRSLIHKVVEHLDVIYLEVVYQTGSLCRKAVRFDNIVAPVQKLGSVDLRFAVSSSLKAVCIIIEALMT